MAHGETERLQKYKLNARRRGGEASDCGRFPLTFNRTRLILLVVPSQPLSNSRGAYRNMC